MILFSITCLISISGKDYKVYKVHLSLQAVYCLGSKVRVLTTLSDDCAIIAFKSEHADQILQLIHDKGIVLK